MERIRIIGIVFLMMFACQAQCLGMRCSTTNDIDAVLDEHVFGGPDWGRYFITLSRTCNSIDLESRTNNVDMLKLHVFHKILNLSVTTNMFRADGHLLGKARRIDQNADWVGDVLGERDVLAMLASATGVCEVATNDLAAARIAAKEKDRVLGWSEGSAGHPWSPARANQRAWAKERDRRNAWNAAVEKYRQQMIMTCMRRLDVLWKDVAEAERRRNIRNAVESFGLTMPEDE